MVGEEPVRVLDTGAGRGGFAALLRDAGHEVFCIDRTVELVAGLPARLGTRLHVVGQVESLPFLSCHFDVVTAAQTLHRFAPGLALSEIARVLEARWLPCDRVQHARRHSPLGTATDRLDACSRPGVDAWRLRRGQCREGAESPYFGLLERRNFRNWMPITREGLISMVERRPAVARLDPAARGRLVGEVGAIYDEYARVPDPLMLPFQTSCWRAEVDHSKLVINDDYDDVLQIKL